MQTWVNFWNFFFWICLTGFLFNPTNFINLLFYSELTWLTLYCFTILCGGINDDLILFSLSFFLLGLAALEFCIAFLLIVNFKNFNKSLSFIDEIKTWNQYMFSRNTKLSIKKFIWA